MDIKLQKFFTRNGIQYFILFSDKLRYYKIIVNRGNNDILVIMTPKNKTFVELPFTFNVSAFFNTKLQIKEIVIHKRKIQFRIIL